MSQLLFQDAVEQYLWELFDAAGIEAVIGNMYIGGCPLEKHWNNAQSDAAAYAYRKVVGGKMGDVVYFSNLSNFTVPDGADLTSTKPYAVQSDGERILINM